MSGFGQHNPREMPPHLFARAIRLDYTTAVRSNPERQNCSICPRHWFVDATFPYGDVASRQRLTDVIDRLYELGGELPPRLNENRRRLAKQIAAADRSTRG